jgi:hypothetical protein
MRWRVAPTPRLSGVRNLLIDIEIYLPRGPPVSLLSRKIGKAWAMRVLIVGDRGNADELAEGFEAEGLAVERWPEDSQAATGPAEIAAIARDLREFERALGGTGTDAVVVDSHSSASLAAVLVATKLGTPVAGIEGQEGVADGANGTLIRQLADIELAPSAPAIVSWLRDTYTERP